MKDCSSLSDFEVIQLTLKDNKDYFAELVKRYKNLVFSVVLRMVNNREDAADLSQEVFIKLYKSLDKYYPDYKFSTWVIRITTNHVIDYRRKRKQETVPIDEMEFELPASDTDSPETATVEKERRTELVDIVNNLPDMYKIPIVLFHSQGLSYQEISDITGEPLSKVKNRIFRGRKMLKDLILALEH